jgi:hypothetical protein
MAVGAVTVAGLAVYALTLFAFCLQDDDRGDVDRVIRSLGTLLGMAGWRRS